MRIIALFTALVFAASVNAQVAIKAGDPAPADGVFLTSTQAAKILAGKEAQEQICKANTEYEKQKIESVCALEKNVLQITLDTQKKKYDEIVKLKDEENKRLYEQIEESTADYGAYWFAGGLAFGALLAAGSSIAIFFAAAQANKTPALNGAE